MGVNIHNVTSYYHGNTGERGLEFKIHIPFADKDIAELKAIVAKDDPYEFARWLKKNHPKVFNMIGNSSTPCTFGSWMTLKESGVLDIQQKRNAGIFANGPLFPQEWHDKAQQIYDVVSKE
jgi:hypothetical protein